MRLGFVGVEASGEWTRVFMINPVTTLGDGFMLSFVSANITGVSPFNMLHIASSAGVFRNACKLKRTAFLASSRRFGHLAPLFLGKEHVGLAWYEVIMDSRICQRVFRSFKLIIFN